MPTIETLASLITSSGIELPKVRKSAHFEGAANTRRTRGIRAPITGQNTILWSSLETLIARSRAAIRNNPNAAAAKDSYKANAIGTGIRPISLHPDPKVRSAIHESWQRFVEDSDFDDRTDFYGQQGDAFGAMFESGDVFLRLRMNPKKFSKLEVQLIESDQVPIVETRSIEVAPGHEVFHGVEFDDEGRRVAYHVYRYNPNELTISARKQEMVRIPARELLHLGRVDRPGQVRGIPWLSSALITLYELDKYTDAALLRKQISSMFVGFVRSNNETDPMPSEGTSSSKPGSEFVEDISLEAGTIQQLGLNEEINWSNPPEERDFEAFVRAQLHRIAVGCGTMYHHLTGDLTQVSFSSIRAGVQEFQRRCEQKQFGVFIPQVCRPIFREWLRVQVASNNLNFRDYQQKKLQYEAVEWIPQGWPYVDPLKDITAQIAALKARLTSRAQIINAAGYDKDQIDRENTTDDQLNFVTDDKNMAALLLTQDNKEESQVVQ